MQVSVIIPNFNRADALKPTLLALAAQTLPPEEFEVVLVDDGSTDGSVSTATDLRLPYPLRVLQQSNKGPAAARNAGTRIAQGLVLLFLDSDIILAPEALAAHVQAHQRGPDHLVAGPVEFWPPAVESPWGRIIDRPLGDSRRRELSGKHASEVVELPFYDAWIGNLSILRSSFERIGGFDTRLRAYEDIELAYRASHSGMPVLYVPEAVGYHNHPRSLEERFRQAYAYKQYLPLMLRMHPGAAGLVRPMSIHEPLHWRADSLGMLLAKLRLRLMALPGVLELAGLCLRWLAAIHASDRLLSAVYWRTLAAYEHRGIRAGYRRLAAQSADHS